VNISRNELQTRVSQLGGIKSLCNCFNRIARRMKVDPCINYGPLKIMCVQPILIWCFFMAYTGQVKRKLGKVLGHNSMTPKIVGLKIGCPKTWTRTCASCPYHVMLVPHNLKRRRALMMSQKLGKTYYKPSCSGFCHLITSLIHILELSGVVQQRLFSILLLRLNMIITHIMVSTKEHIQHDFWVDFFE